MKTLNTLLKSTVMVSAIGAASAANATIATVFDGITAGKSNFDSTVTATGATVKSHNINSSLGADQGDFTISNNDGGYLSYRTYGTMSGDVIGINPALNSGVSNTSSGRGPAANYFDSGVSFEFKGAVNSFGFEVGDWATCCQSPVTELYISFDDGAPILVASSTSRAQGLFPSQSNPTRNVYEIFVAAFDDSSSFSKVSFWGNGLGEVLVAGGNVRYALLDQGSLNPTAVSAPSAALLLGLGLAGIVARRKTKA